MTTSAHIPHQHHHRRYHYPPEALGYGYERFNFVLPDALRHTKTQLVKQLQLEALNEQETAHTRARNGMWFCAGVLLFILLCLQFHGLFPAYLRALFTCFGLDDSVPHGS